MIIAALIVGVVFAIGWWRLYKYFEKRKESNDDKPS